MGASRLHIVYSGFNSATNYTPSRINSPQVDYTCLEACNLVAQMHFLPVRAFSCSFKRGLEEHDQTEG